MTNEDPKNSDQQIDSVIKRIFSPQNDADRELMWTAIVAFAFGALIF
ncbi:hypothetical protein [Sphingomicrobium sediminis]|uniref:Uncharacterized protein n=1 Tax=Sphingomicrobium sediminis TaxID=2950949 RepID=A0A9X2J2K6_9SPHN|nr:hypothetical protein [Sphingomicrobium sediminis]MCM8557125.1 hypothetical protein [Sphingomicrobium sediminis]